MVGTESIRDKIESPIDDIVGEILNKKTTNSQNETLTEEQIQQIDDIIRGLNNNEDLLYQANCLQLVADLWESKPAVKLLEDKQVPQKIISLLNDPDPVIVPHALKLFYRIDPLDIEIKYPQLLDKLCDYFESGNNEFMDYSIDLISAISQRGYLARKVIERHPYLRTKCLPKIGAIIISSSELFKCRTLVCVKNLLTVQECDPKEESIALSESFYHQIIPGELTMTKQLMELCVIPLMAIRINALQVVATVADQLWCQKELAAHHLFPKWIVDRSTEKCKEGKEAKYEILKAIIESKTGSKSFKGEDYLKMRADFKMGAFYVGIAEEMMVNNEQAT